METLIYDERRLALISAPENLMMGQISVFPKKKNAPAIGMTPYF